MDRPIRFDEFSIVVEACLIEFERMEAVRQFFEVCDASHDGKLPRDVLLGEFEAYQKSHAIAQQQKRQDVEKQRQQREAQRVVGSVEEFTPHTDNSNDQASSKTTSAADASCLRTSITTFFSDVPPTEVLASELTAAGFWGNDAVTAADIYVAVRRCTKERKPG